MLLTYAVLAFFVISGGIITCCLKEARSIKVPCKSLQAPTYPTRNR
ncbi:MAG: hypothetical protein ACJA2K_002158 [Thalassolituus sp.]|jgi:hypothetical protein